MNAGFQKILAALAIAALPFIAGCVSEAERQRIAVEKAEQARLAKLEQERLERERREKAEAERQRVAAEKAERERLAKLEQERLNRNAWSGSVGKRPRRSGSASPPKKRNGNAWKSKGLLIVFKAKFFRRKGAFPRKSVPAVALCWTLSGTSICRRSPNAAETREKLILKQKRDSKRSLPCLGRRILIRRRTTFSKPPEGTI